MSVCFGFSVGDVLAVGKFVKDMVVAVQDSAGAVAEYTTLMQ